MGLLSTKTGLPSFAAADNAIVNYFTDGGFERGSNGVIPSGWAQYNDGAVAVPVDGTGGSAVAQVTMLCTNSSPIRGTLSAVISKDANNRQGVGYSCWKRQEGNEYFDPHCTADKPNAKAQ